MSSAIAYTENVRIFAAMKTKLQQIADGELKRVELHLPTDVVKKGAKKAAETSHKPKQYFEQVIINDLKNSM